MKVITKRLGIKVLAVLLLGVLSLGGLFLHNSGNVTVAADSTESVNVTDLLETTGTLTQDSNGLRISSDVAYTAKFKGVFTGDTTFKFTFPETFKDAYYGDFKFRIADATDESNYFDINYYVVHNANRYTALYTQYKDEVRQVHHAGSAWLNEQQHNKMNYRVSPSFLSYCGPTGQYHGDRLGILSLTWDKDILTVSANSPTQESAVKMLKMASFDGTYDPEKPSNGFESGKTWGLPKLNFENGYTITISSSFENKATTDQATDVLFNEIAGIDLLTCKTVNPTYKCEATFENAVVSDEDVYIPQNDDIGEVNLVYSRLFGLDWGIREVVKVTQPIDVSTVGTKTLTISDDSWKTTPLGAVTKSYNLHVETPYTLTFDVQGGEPIDSILFSDHTEHRVFVSDTSRIFWKFDGWYIDDQKWTGNVADLYGKSVTLTAHWLDEGAPTIWLNGISDKTFVEKGAKLTVGKADVVAGDEAQNENVVITVALKKPNETAFTAISDVYELTLDAVGSYAIQYTVTDPAGFTASCERSIEVFDRAVPTITVEEGFKTQAHPDGKVTLAKATAKNVDGEELDIIVSIVKDGVLIENNGTEFTPTELGEYTVTFLAKDNAPYDTLQSIYSYTIVVGQDNEAPVIGDEFTDMTVALNAQVTIPTITATDNVSENIVVEILVYYGTQKIELTNNSFKADQAGAYRVLLVAQDDAGNKTEKTVYITVNAGSGAGGCGCSCSDTTGGLGLPIGLLMIAGSFVFGKNIMMKKMKRKENI